MPGTSFSFYINDEDYPYFSEIKEFLFLKCKELIKREVEKVKEGVSKAQEVPVIPSVLEDVADEGLHDKLARKRQERASDKLYGTKMRHKKGKGGLLI